MKRLIALLSLLILCIALLTLPAVADGSGPSKAEIREKWATVTTSSTVFDQEPSIRAPYTTGALTEEFLASGISYLNYVRFVAGLPEVELDEDLNDLAQHGAVCLAAIDELTHYPSRPAGMSKDFYDTAYEATTSSNISARMGYEPEECLASAVFGCMGDNSSKSNLTTLGHRRWLLNPTLGKVGFGYAQSETGWSYIVNHVFDRSGKGVNYNYIAWPVDGNQPTNIFSVKDPWSVTLNPSKYKVPELDDLKITITQESDGKTWTFNSRTGTPSDHRSAYLTVNSQWYGVPNCIIFHPGSANVEKYAGEYTVEISGLRTASGKKTSLRYEVDFFDLYECEHEFGYFTEPSTCTTEGYTCQMCMLCGYECDRKALPLADHSWEAATCQSARCCSVCGEKTGKPDRDAHSYTSVTIQPDCENGGYDQLTCQLCGEKDRDNFKKPLGHDSIVTETAPTCTEPGHRRTTCSRCDWEKSENCAEALGHQLEGWLTDSQDHWKACLRCDQEGERGAHIPGPEATEELGQYCTVCNYELAAPLEHTHAYTLTQTAPDCVNAGYTLHTCAGCGHSYQDTPVAALGHDFREGICTRCGAVDESFVPKFEIAYANMTLGNSLAMNFAFPCGEEDYSACYAQVVKKYSDGRQDLQVKIPYAQWSTAGIGGLLHYVLKFDDVAAKEMSDTVYVTICDAQGNAISETWEDSVRDYAMRTLNNPKTSRESATMVVDLLNYGAAAQQYFGYNTGDLANNQLTATQKALATQNAPAADSRVMGTNYQKSNLGLESQILMRMAFTQAPADAYATIEFTNHSGTKIREYVASSEIQKSGSYSVVVIDEIVIADGRKPVTVTIYNADGTVFATGTDSVESYIARMSNADTLYEMILKFSDSAYSFFHN